MINYFHIGQLSAVHGTEGELLLKHSLGKKTALKEVQALFVEDRKDSFLPYFVQSARAKDASHVYVKLEGVNTREEGLLLLKKGVYLQEEDFHRQASSAAPLSLLGFQVEDQRYGPVGEIAEIIEMPLQVLAKVLVDGKELLLPVNEQTLLKIDRKKRMVQLDLPEGLLEIYLK